MTTGTVDDVATVIAHMAAGFDAAWDLLHDRVPSAVFDRARAVASSEHAMPARDPEVLAHYLAAQVALRFAYHRLVASGGPAFWVSEPDERHITSTPVDPLLLCGVLVNLRQHGAHLDADARQSLRVAERKLKPFWQAPRQPRMCRTCETKPAAGDRRDCWTCAGRRRTKRQVRVSRHRAGAR